MQQARERQGKCKTSRHKIQGQVTFKTSNQELRFSDRPITQASTIKLKAGFTSLGSQKNTLDHPRSLAEIRDNNSSSTQKMQTAS